MNGRWMMLLALGALAGCPSEADKRVDDVLALTGDASAGSAAYTLRCDVCHEADGTGGGSFPDLTAYLAASSDADFVYSMLDGPGTMPSFSASDDQELADILAFAKTL